VARAAYRARRQFEEGPRPNKLRRAANLQVEGIRGKGGISSRTSIQGPPEGYRLILD
jgi:hypothetical protein